MKSQNRIQTDNLIAGLMVIKPQIFKDHRGFFLERRAFSDFQGVSFVQDNISFSHQNVIRGLHFQPGQAKFVSVIDGEILDVAVDIRQDSPTFKQYSAVLLSSQIGNSLFIPDGFAHGFCVLSPSATVFYSLTTPYDPKQERGFSYHDSEIAIRWPILDPILSDRDRNAPSFGELCACGLLASMVNSPSL